MKTKTKQSIHVTDTESLTKGKKKNNFDIFCCLYECCVSVVELYTVTVLTEAAMMGADIDGDVLLYLDMAQVSVPLTERMKMNRCQVKSYPICTSRYGCL